MKIGDIHQVRSEAVQVKVKSLNEAIQQLSSRLEKRKEIDKELQLNKESKNETVDWTDVYKKWDDWEDAEEIQNEVNESKKKLMKLKRNHDKTNIKRGNNTSFCCSRQNRDDEKKVIMMTNMERLAHMQSFRNDHGNLEYRRGNFDLARKWYNKSLIYYEYCYLSCGQEAKQVEEERILCLLNIAACDIALKRYNDCIEMCNEALGVSNCTEEHKVKALLRRAKAYRYTLRFQKSKKDLDETKQIITAFQKIGQTFSRDMDNEYKLLIQALEKYYTDSKDFAKRMMRSC